MNDSAALRIVVVGHVDHGKSTLIGRLLYDTGSIDESRVTAIKETCASQGRDFEFAYLMDALEEEQQQNVTIDTAQIFFSTEKRKYVIIDAPGHREFLKNMITGAASADAAVLLIDGVEGLREQTRRHAYLLSLLGVRQVVVAVNKMDKANYSEEVFLRTENEIRNYLHGLDIIPLEVIPLSARDGENLAFRKEATPWYSGPTLIEALDGFSDASQDENLPFRFPVQDVYKWDGRRIYVGRVESGSVNVGDKVVFMPSGRDTRVATIEKWGEADIRKSGAGESIGLTFTDDLFVERGEILAHADRAPVAAWEVSANLFWLSREPFKKGKSYTIKLATAELEATCVEITDRLDSSTLQVKERHAEQLEPTETGRVTFSFTSPIAADAYLENSKTGRFVVEDGVIIGGGGIISEARGRDGVATAQVIDLDTHFSTEPTGNLVDLTRERGNVEFRITDHFLNSLNRGEKLLFLLRGPEQLEHVGKLAFENHLDFNFTRRDNHAAIVLYKEAAKAVPEEGFAVGL